MESFDVYFLGEILPDADPASTQRAVAKLFKASDDAIGRLFSGQPLRIKEGIDVDLASRYRAMFREAGALLQIVPNGAAPPPARAPVPIAAPAPDEPAGAATAAASAAISLAEPGATIDTTPSPEPADIDTSGLSAAPPNTGTLEDCKIDKAPYPIPDISHLDFVDN